MKWYFFLALICMSLMTNGVEHMLIDYLYIFFGEVPVEVLCPLLNCVSFPFVLGVLFILWILIPYLTYSCKYCLPDVGCLFTFFFMSFDAQEFLLLMKSNLPLFFFVDYSFGAVCKNLLPNQMLRWFIFLICELF